MIGLVLFLIVLSQFIIMFQLRAIIRVLDFSKEDAQVKATTERVKKAKDRLPKPQEE